MRQYVILGCGPAGRAAAREVRKQDRTGEVILVSKEFTPFYLRPALPDFVAGSLGRSDIVIQDKEILEDPAVHVWSGCRVYRLFPHESRVFLSDGTSLHFDRLLLATGAGPRREDRARGCMHALATFSEAIRISRSGLSKGELVLVAGEGYTGLEAVRAFVKRGCRVVYITTHTRFWNPRSSVARADVLEKLTAENVEVIFDEAVFDVLDLNGELYRVVTSSRRVIDANLVCEARELAPGLDYLEGSGIVTDHGVVVDLELRTNFPHILGAGDAAQVFDRQGNWHRVNFGWESAAQQGQVAGHNLVHGGGKSVAEGDLFFAQLYGTKLLERWSR